MTQKETILRHLYEKGPISQLEATREYMILRLSARIEELRKDGHYIINEDVKMLDKRYVKYRLLSL